ILLVPIGWLFNDSRNKKRTLEQKVRETNLKRLENQVQMFYSPISTIRTQCRAVHKFYHSNMPKEMSDLTRIDVAKMEKVHWRIHDYITDNYLIPLNNKVIDIIENNAHLVDEEKFPNSFLKFIEHVYEFEVRHRLYTDFGLKELITDQKTFPDNFDTSIEDKLKELRAKYYLELNNIKVQ
ncbi:hypothetical protein, partial [Psychroserpens sp.]|uniref:hypothetical protein n=1 Tax=Psychroserpens sp. TaxID=2020870 RepID=UPI00385E3C7B